LLPSVPKIATGLRYILQIKKIMANSMIKIATMTLAMKTVKKGLSVEKVMPIMTTAKMDS